MTDKGEAPERLSLSRWSRRKLETNAGRPAVPESAKPAAPAAAPPAAPATSPELPSVEALSFDSDFTAFLRPDVDETLRRAALKQLFRDPRFNVMDGLDVYIDDYTKADPIPPDIVQDLLQRGFSAVTSAPNWPVEEPTAGSAPAPSVTGPAAEPLPPPETTVASAPVASGEPEPAPEPAPEPPTPSRSS